MTKNLDNCAPAKQGEAGGVIIELAIILPIVLLIGLTTFELVRVIRLVNIAATLSREAVSYTHLTLPTKA